jgi:hypothetical protein
MTTPTAGTGNTIINASGLESKGSQFTDKQQTAGEGLPVRPEGEVFTARKARTNGEWLIDCADSDPVAKDGFFRIIVGGEPHTNTRIGAAIRLYTDDDRREAREDLDAFAAAGEKVTVLIEDGNRVRAIEGTASHIAGETVLLCKGSRGPRFQHYPASKMKVLRTVKGFGKQAVCAADFDQKAAIVPVAVPVNVDGIPDHGNGYPPEDEMISAAFLINGNDFGNGAEPGCMFLATDIQTADGIVNGYFWSPDDAGLLTSESSSMYLEDVRNEEGRLVQKGLKSSGGRIRDYEAGSLSFESAWKNLSEDRALGYRQILGR